MIDRLDPDNPPSKEQLREIRDVELQLSIRSLAAELGYHYLTVWRYERGTFKPSRAFLRDLQTFRDQEAARRAGQPPKQSQVKQKPKSRRRKKAAPETAPAQVQGPVEAPAPSLREPEQTIAPGTEAAVQTAETPVVQTAEDEQAGAQPPAAPEEPTAAPREQRPQEPALQTPESAWMVVFQALAKHTASERRQLERLFLRFSALILLLVLGSTGLQYGFVVYETRRVLSSRVPEQTRPAPQPPPAQATAAEPEEDEEEPPPWAPPEGGEVADGGSAIAELRRMPGEPYSWQKRPPCNPSREVEKRNGCWFENKNPPPCDGDYEAQDGDQCYSPVPAPRRKRPNVTDPRLNRER